MDGGPERPSFGQEQDLFQLRTHGSKASLLDGAQIGATRGANSTWARGNPELVLGTSAQELTSRRSI